MNQLKKSCHNFISYSSPSPSPSTSTYLSMHTGQRSTQPFAPPLIQHSIQIPVEPPFLSLIFPIYLCPFHISYLSCFIFSGVPYPPVPSFPLPPYLSLLLIIARCVNVNVNLNEWFIWVPHFPTIFLYIIYVTVRNCIYVNLMVLFCPSLSDL